MTKQELIERVYRSRGLPPDLTKKAVQLVIDAVFAEISDYFAKAKVTKQITPKFTYPGFGTFTKRHRDARTGRNPQTGDPITIPSAQTLGLVPGQDLKQLLNKSK